MANRSGKKRMTLSEHLALRERMRKLEQLPSCTCPACVRRREAYKRSFFQGR